VSCLTAASRHASRVRYSRWNASSATSWKTVPTSRDAESSVGARRSAVRLGRRGSLDDRLRRTRITDIGCRERIVERTNRVIEVVFPGQVSWVSIAE